MTPAIKAMIGSYLRNALATAISIIVIVGNGASPFSFTASQWADVSNALWAALIPVVLRYLNTKDPAFGLIAKPILEDAKKQTAKKIIKKK